MKKIERFLRDYGIIVKICLVIVWVLWAIQLAGPIKSTFTEELAYQKTRNAELEQKAMREMFALGNELEKEATLFGENYGPKEYFVHLKRINEKAREGRIGEPMMITNTLQDKIFTNVKKGKLTYEQIRAEADLHREWLDSRISHREELPQLTLQKLTP